MVLRALTLTLCLTCSLVLPSLFAGRASSADHRAELVDEAPPAGSVAPDIAALLGSKAIRVTRGSTRTLCDIWLCKQWDLKTFDAGADLLYPFEPGQLIGVVRFHRRGAGFRDQDIDKGVYTLRYAQQPVDGAHVGTSLTRDFLLLVSAESDKNPKVMRYDPLTEASAEVAGSSHPAMLAMKKIQGDGKPGSLRENASEDWWLARLAGRAKAGGKEKDLAFDLVVVGVFNE